MTFFNSTSPQSQRMRRARRGGQTLVEFALVVIVFLALVMGMLQFGVYLSSTNALWNLSREGARYATVQDPTKPGADDAIIAHIKAVVPPPLASSEINSITVLPVAASRTYGSTVTVTIVYNMSKKLFIPTGNLVFNSQLGKVYTTKSAMMMESGPG